LHDSVGQLLVGWSMNMSTVRSEIERLTKAAAVLSDSETLIQEMSQEVRTISHLLHPPLLDEAGLASAIRWYIEGFAQRSHIKVDLDCPEDFGRLPRDVETAMFRVVQECLTNIHRHSGSQIASVRCLRVDNRVIVEVADHGAGISPEKLALMESGGSPGVGIKGMRERPRQLGGYLGITCDGKGTVVAARVPIPEAFLLPDSSDLDASKAAA
jgi:two-component system, NarL family, sensor kinase